MSDSPLYVFWVGPTAVGKSAQALEIAVPQSIPILNTDSLQVYQHLNIGTAKPSLQDRQSTPHWLFDYVPAPCTLSAADYLKDAVQTLNNDQGKTVFFVGGSGFYIQALERGMFKLPEMDPNTRQQAEIEWGKLGGEKIYEQLKLRDPLWAQKVSVQDHYRVRRAHEIHLATGKTVTQMQKELAESNHSPLPPHRKLKIGMYFDRDILLKRVTLRVDQMLRAGWINEVEEILKLGFQSWSPLQSVGYKQIISYLEGGIPLADLKEKIAIANMQLIKKQMTWFRRDKEIQWFQADQNKAIFESYQAALQES